MTSAYVAFTADPDKHDHPEYSKNLDTLTQFERVAGKLDDATKVELKAQLLEQIAAGVMFAQSCANETDRRKRLEDENARLRRANMELQREVSALREMFGYD